LNSNALKSEEPLIGIAIAELFSALKAGRYGFIDIGCGVGGSIDHCTRLFNRGAGVGIDIHQRQLTKAIDSGHDVAFADINQIDFPASSVSFCSMMDFLEHLPSLQAAEEVLKKCAIVSRDFLYIRHPSFEETEYLKNLNLKITWADWRTHYNLMTIENYREIFSRNDWKDFFILPRRLIKDSSNEVILPLSAEHNSKFYDPTLHEEKAKVVFEKPIFEQYDIFVRLPGNNMSSVEWANISSSTMYDYIG